MRRPLILLALLMALLMVLAGCDSGTATHHSSGPPFPVGHAGTRGTPSATALADQPGSAWRIPSARNGGIEGFADHVSVSPGQSVRLFVSTAAATFVVHAYRMGWYRGMQGRLVWTSPSTTGHRQAAPAMVAPATRTMAARWSPSLTVSTSGWLPGDYLLRLDAAGHHQSFVPLTVRAPSAAGRVVLLNAVTTWQAYNLWGCCNLYQGGDGSFAARSRVVSFDRPYAAGYGAGEFIDRELPVVAEAERLGLPLDFVTDVDLQADPHLLDGARAVISMGHDEYWSPAMRAVLTAARDAGANLASFGANAVFRRIRYAATALGANRLEINYKIAAEDPLNGHDDAAVTANWPDPPKADPESSLLGDQYGCFPGRTRVDGVIADPGNWMFAGIHVTKGERLPGLVGPETDAVQLGYPTPRPIEVVLHSPTHCPGGSPTHADASYYVARSGAGVFDAGTIDWVCAVGGSCHGRISGPTHDVTRQVTDNLLRAFARGPAGREHPVHENLAALGITH